MGLPVLNLRRQGECFAPMRTHLEGTQEHFCILSLCVSSHKSSSCNVWTHGHAPGLGFWIVLRPRGCIFLSAQFTPVESEAYQLQRDTDIESFHCHVLAAHTQSSGVRAAILYPGQTLSL